MSRVLGVTVLLGLLLVGSAEAGQEKSSPSPGWGKMVEVRSVWAITFKDRDSCERLANSVSPDPHDPLRIRVSPGVPYRCEQVHVPVTGTEK
jgi:hypothetical protein